METSTRKRSITVGLFVVIGIIIFVVGILTIGSMKKVFSSTITVKTIFDDVNGLKQGNNIWYSGVKIGTVKSIRFLTNSRVEVLLNIEEKSQEFIRKNAKAKVSTDGLIGNKIIVLYGGTQKVPSIEDGDVLLVEKMESTEEMLAVLSENNKNLLGITSAFKTISKNILEGKGTVGMLLNDKTLYNDVDQTMAAMKKAAVNAQTLTASVSGFTEKLNQKGGLANDFATDTIIMRDLRGTIGKLSETVSSANVMVNNLKTASADLNSNTTSPLGVLMHDEATAANLKGTLKNLETSTEKLDENMQALRSNFLFRRYFKRKAKDEAKQPANVEVKEPVNQ
ncbi:MlaD family protein [Dyadobacter arcticus]|uniref:Phospholipid/cholesterol/gamma-HCH transport system substrate-binding protein n=1 Tax=Dyadobacter arcticus TaxID=1078754 RepID=A0ABX0ULA2_9BACT|nr:MCE family protein [Dyadobacter arcticus]NIJ53662.1 phospholipid/cholesterol/gamma-HCH transport system substrate-binding protein [Dyadobacter arcticus]